MHYAAEAVFFIKSFNKMIGKTVVLYNLVIIKKLVYNIFI